MIYTIRPIIRNKLFRSINLFTARGITSEHFDTNDRTEQLPVLCRPSSVFRAFCPELSSTIFIVSTRVVASTPLSSFRLQHPPLSQTTFRSVPELLPVPYYPSSVFNTSHGHHSLSTLHALRQLPVQSY